VPAAHGVGEAEPAGQKDPGGHGLLQVALEVAPASADHVPAGHGIAAAAPAPQ
jgi:hypothetical protein